MKLLVSDYDQTLSMDDITIKFNLKKIKEFRDNGNIFMLSTGRTYSSIKEEIKKWNISYDYLSCVDGTSLYDCNDNLLFNLKLDKADLKYSDYLKLKYESKISFFDIDSDKSGVPEERIIQIHDIHFKDIIIEIKDYFDEYINNSDYLDQFNYIYLRPKSINKSTTINYLEQKLKISHNSIFTIGDHNNDYEMIRDYNGFTMLWGTKKAKEYALKKYLMLSQLICDIENPKEEFTKKLRFK